MKSVFLSSSRCLQILLTVLHEKEVELDMVMKKLVLREQGTIMNDRING